MKDFDREVTDKESTTFFGKGEGREVEGPISAILCKKNGCPKISLQSNPPDLPDDVVGDKDQTVAIGGDEFLPNLTDGKEICPSNKIITEVQCKRRNCGSLRLRCSALNSKLYEIGSSTVTTNWTSGGLTKCPKTYFMVGMECDADGGVFCNRLRLICSKIRFKAKKPGCGLVDPPTNEPPTPSNPPSPQCKDKTLHGQQWTDRDGIYCRDYAARSGWCQKYGDGYRNTYTANEACCACGGGRQI